MYRQKAVAVALMLILVFNILAVLGGEFNPDGYEPEDKARYSRDELDAFLGRLHGTRAGESLNVDLLSRMLYGPALCVAVSGNYAYACAGFNLLVLGITDKANPELVGSTWIYSTGPEIEIDGSYVYIADSQFGLLIFDISNPTTPQRIGGYQIQEGFLATDISVSGSHAYLAAYDRYDIYNPDNGFLVIDISTKTDPQLVGEYTGYLVGGVDAVGSTVYASCSSQGLRIVDMSSPSSPVDLGNNDTIVGYDLDVFGNTAYVVDGMDHLWPVNVTDPSNPDVLTDYLIDGPVGVHVDMSNNIAYVAGFTGLTLLDVSDPSSPVELDSIDTGDPVIGVFQEGTYAYTASRWEGLVIIDAADPLDITLEGSYFTGACPRDVAVNENIAYIADASAEMLMYDVSAPTNPVQIGIPADGWHSQGVEVRDNYAYVVGGDQLLVYNIANPASPTQSGSTWLTGYYEDMYLEYPYVYVATGEDGISIVDVNNPSAPNEVNVYSQVSEAYGVHVSNGYLYIADGDYGLRIADLTNPETPGPPVTSPTGDTAMDVFVRGNYAYVAINESGLRIVEVTNPMTPQPRSTADTNGNSLGVFVTGGHAYVADGAEGLIVVDVTDALNPNWAGYYNTSGLAEEVLVNQDIAYVCTLWSGVYLLDVSSFSPPQISSTTPISNATNVNVDTSIVIDFTEVMDTNSAENAFSYTDGVGTWGTGAGNVVWSNGDMTFTFTPFTPLDYGVDYTVTMAHTAEDLDGNGLDGDGDGAGGEGPEDDYIWSFTTTPPPPTIVSISPENLAADVPIESFIIVNFSQAMDTASAENAFNYTDGTTVWDATNGGAMWSNGDTTLTFNPSEYLNDDAEYWVTISRLAMDTEGALLDGDEDGISGEVGDDDYTWSFTTESLPPTVISAVPILNAIMVPINASIIINFSKSMDEASIQNAFGYTDGSQTWDIFDGSYSWSNDDKNLTFTPFTVFDYDTEYEFTVLHTAKDMNGIELDADEDGMPGETGDDDFIWSFTTLPPSPEVISTFPEDSSSDMPVGVNIVINFSKSMNRASLLSAFIYTDGTNVFGSSDGIISWSNSDTTFTFTPNAVFENAAQYAITVSYLAEDTIGFLLDGDGDGTGGEGPEDDYVWSFSTIPIPPTVNSTYPSHGATLVNIDTSVIINFSKSMDKEDTLAALEYIDGSSTYLPSESQVEWTNNNMTLTFTPPSFFDNEKTISFTVYSTAKDEEGAYLDADGDGKGGEVDQDDYSFSFTTMHLPARVLQITPSKKATLVEVDTDILIRFSRSMDNNSVEAAFSYTNENTTTTWGASDGEVQWNPDSKVMTFTPDEALEHDREYTVTVLASAMDTLGVALDTNNDKLPGIEDYTWTFTTIKEPPEVISVEPENNTIDVPLDKLMIIRFDRSMDTKSIEKAFSFTHNGTSETWDIVDGTSVWTEDSSVLTFNPDFNLQEGRIYTVTIEDTAEDEDGVSFLGLEWQFTTKVNTPPLLENGGAGKEEGDTYKFTIVYTDSDEPTEKLIIIDEVEFRMYESDRQDDVFIDGKNYEYQINLDEGEYEYYFEFSDGKNRVSFPGGDDTIKLEVSATEEEGGGLGLFEEEYAGVPGMICFSLGIIIIIIVIVVAVMMITRKGKRAKRMEETGLSFQSFEPETSFQTFDDSPVTFSLPGDEPMMSFAPIGEEPAMSFTTFEETPPSLDAVQPAVVQCPDCGEYLRVRAAHRPFEFPCKCGAKLVLK